MLVKLHLWTTRVGRWPCTRYMVASTNGARYLCTSRGVYEYVETGLGKRSDERRFNPPPSSPIAAGPQQIDLKHPTLMPGLGAESKRSYWTREIRGKRWKQALVLQLSQGQARTASGQHREIPRKMTKTRGISGEAALGVRLFRRAPKGSFPGISRVPKRKTAGSGKGWRSPRIEPIPRGGMSIFGRLGEYKGVPLGVWKGGGKPGKRHAERLGLPVKASLLEAATAGEETEGPGIDDYMYSYCPSQDGRRRAGSRPPPRDGKACFKHA
jgi:hypothetical protein